MSATTNPSAPAGPALGHEERGRLLDIADTAIVDGLLGRSPTPPQEEALPPTLRRVAGTFVTLTIDGALNGCIGSIEGTGPLGIAVAHHAWAAAFTDPRLPALRRSDYDRLLIEVSVLSPLRPIPVASRDELLGELRPLVDGLVIEAGRQAAVFLPDVWEQLPQPSAFLDHLQRKAGLPAGVWIEGLRAFRFTTEHFARPAGTTEAPHRVD